MKVGLYGIGLDTYWNQFDGLLKRLERYQAQIADRLRKMQPDLHIINLGIVDNPSRAREIGDELAHEKVGLILHSRWLEKAAAET